MHSLQQRFQLMPGRQVLRLVMPCLVGATHDRSSRGFKLCRLVGLNDMVSRGLGGDHACVGARTQGGGVVWHHGGVGGWPRLVLHLGYGRAEDRRWRILERMYEARSLVLTGSR
jgi:hypothetical protein